MLSYILIGSIVLSETILDLAYVSHTCVHQVTGKVKTSLPSEGINNSWMSTKQLVDK